jgi:hypothetical protein
MCKQGGQAHVQLVWKKNKKMKNKMVPLYCIGNSDYLISTENKKGFVPLTSCYITGAVL